MSMGDKVEVRDGDIPGDYHCACAWCSKAIGELRPLDGSYYSRLERRAYYSPTEKGKGGHIAKTPLHIARWAIQAYSKKGDWVLDPTIGAGTTAVESLTQGRSVAGMELEFGQILSDNIKKALSTIPKGSAEAKVAQGDARNIGDFLKKVDQKFKLVVNNPPYSGDKSVGTLIKGGPPQILYAYDKKLPNLAFLNEGPVYIETMTDIYKACVSALQPGGHFVVGVKDMMRKREPFLLHQIYCRILEDLGMEYVGAAFLKHYPGTLFLNTYFTARGVHPPYYQTIVVFKKPGGRAAKKLS